MALFIRIVFSGLNLALVVGLGLALRSSDALLVFVPPLLALASFMRSGDRTLGGLAFGANVLVAGGVFAFGALIAAFLFMAGLMRSPERLKDFISVNLWSMGWVVCAMNCVVLWRLFPPRKKQALEPHQVARVAAAAGSRPKAEPDFPDTWPNQEKP
jgi:hypothetical protein